MRQRTRYIFEDGAGQKIAGIKARSFSAGKGTALIRFNVIHIIIIGVIAFTLMAKISAWADDNSMKNVLSLPGFAEDWTAKDPVNLYDRDTLFEHINGEAELYIPYGFDMLATVTYVNRSNPEVWLIADVYRMGSLLDAFGIYANYRRAKAEGVTIGGDGFILPSQLMFYQDRYFVRLQVTGATSLQKNIFLACGRAIAQKLPNNEGRPRELELLRIPALVPGSERYITQSLLGYAFFRRGIIADAVLEGKQMQIFVIMNDDQAAAQKAFAQYRSYLMTEGRDLQVTASLDLSSLTAIDPLYGEVFAEQFGGYIIGAIRVKDTSAAKQIVEQMRVRIGGSKSP
jgi:hypothetical protein